MTNMKNALIQKVNEALVSRVLQRISLGEEDGTGKVENKPEEEVDGQ
jgi:hypothetical protein